MNVSLRAVGATLALACALGTHAAESGQALVISISRYRDPAFSPLPGAARDRASATDIALAMGIPKRRIAYLSDERATGDAIRGSLKRLAQRVQADEPVYVHFSGHGTRYEDAARGGCVEALLAHDGGQPGTLTNAEMAALLTPIAQRSGKLFVMYDACHSGGVAAAAGRPPARSTRAKLTPRYAPTSPKCDQVANVRTRSLVPEVAPGRYAVHLSSSRSNEVSLDDAEAGGLATQFVRRCMLDARSGGAMTIDEIRRCAQERIELRLKDDPRFRAQHLVLWGSRRFTPLARP